MTLNELTKDLALGFLSRVHGVVFDLLEKLVHTVGVHLNFDDKTEYVSCSRSPTNFVRPSLVLLLLQIETLRMLEPKGGCRYGHKRRHRR